MGEIVVGIDIGTTKVCTIVGEVRANDTYVLGVGIEPARGMRKGMVTDVDALSTTISSSVHKAERASGYEIGRAIQSGKKVLCLFRPNSEKNLSAMISGCPDLRVINYENFEDAKRSIKEFLE